MAAEEHAVIAWPDPKPVGCYVYRIKTGRYVYVGKGTRKRGARQRYRDHIIDAAEHLLIRRLDSYHNRKKLGVLARALDQGDQITIEIVRDDMTDEHAFALEVEEIACVSKRWRLNVSEGGEGWTSETARRNAMARAKTPEGRTHLLCAARRGAEAWGRWAVESGHLSRIARLGGLAAIESGHLARISEIGAKTAGRNIARRARERWSSLSAEERSCRERRAIRKAAYYIANRDRLRSKQRTYNARRRARKTVSTSQPLPVDS